MSDIYQKVANSPVGRQVVQALNLPSPVILDRSDSADKSSIKGKILIGGTTSTPVTKVASEILSAEKGGTSASILVAENVKSSSSADNAIALDAIAETQRFKALVFDATGIENSTGLRAAYDFFHPTIRHIDKCGRIIVIGRPTDKCDSPAKATAQKALEGFVRSMAKEIGKKAATAQLIYVEPGAEKNLDAPLSFLASPRSAYVDAQIVRVSKTTGKAPTINWSKPLEGKVALVTGASRGIGEAIAEVLARDGARVVCLDVPQAQEGLDAVANRISGESLALDITQKDAPESIANYFQEKHGGLDIIVHNAGVTRDKTLARMKPQFWDLLMDINLCSIERINEKLLADNVINKNGRIVGVASISGIAGNFGQTNYAMSKSGVIGYVEAMSPTLKDGITINAVAPGFIETQMTAAIPFTIREAGRRMNSLSQGGQPQDVAETIAFYANPGANGVTGNTIRVCGQSLLGK